MKPPFFIGFFAALVLATAFCSPRVSAQADAGPQGGAPPSDQPAAQSAPGGSQLGGHPNLSGSWTLNKDQSDDPRAKMREAMGGGGGGQGGGGGRFGGGMGGGRGQNGGGMMAALDSLTIEQTATSAKVSNANGRVIASYPGSTSDASKDSSANSSDSDEEAAPAAAKWSGNQLVTSLQGRRGGSTTRTYELSPDGKQLYVTTKIDNPRLQQPLTIRLVYDPASTNK